jgi:hypothetical protein
MPIHDWTRVDAGLFHAFHHNWISSLCGALNSGHLPSEFYALPEQRIQGPIPDVLTLKLAIEDDTSSESSGGLAVATVPPRARLIQRSEAEIYSRKANRIVVRHRHGEVVSVVEIVSPGNKGSKGDFQSFVRKSVDLIHQGIHLMVIDLFPPGKRDPHGIHQAIWEEFEEDGTAPIDDKPLTLASYNAGPMRTAYVEPVAVGDVLADMPLFLSSETYIPAPLEATYQTAWSMFPAALKGLLQAK